MTAPARADRVLSDPIGLVVELVGAAEPALAPECIRGVVTAVAGGRAKARRLAAALAHRPGVLLDGRSPAPRAVGELLLAAAPRRRHGDLVRHVAPSAANSCAPCSAAAGTGTARSAIGAPNRALAAGTPDRSPRATARGGPAAPSAQTSTAGTRSR